MPGYFELTEYISNSDLGDLKNTIYGKEKPLNIQSIYDFGNLVDGMITEAHRIGVESYSLKAESGSREIIFETDDFEKAQLMTECFKDHPEVKKMFVGMKFQYIFLRKSFRIEYAGHTITVKARCKFDAFSKRLGIDIKTTACTSQKAFIESIEHFDYDRAAAWYMDLAGIDRFLFIGISKKRTKRGKHEIYLFAVERGDETYERGKAKYNKWAFKYHFMIQPLFDPAIMAEYEQYAAAAPVRSADEIIIPFFN